MELLVSRDQVKKGWGAGRLKVSDIGCTRFSLSLSPFHILDCGKTFVTYSVNYESKLCDNQSCMNHSFRIYTTIFHSQYKTEVVVHHTATRNDHKLLLYLVTFLQWPSD